MKIRIHTTLWESLKLSFLALRGHKMRAFLTTLGIFVGIFVFVLIHSLIVGVNTAFYRSISAIGSDILYVQKFSWTSRDDWFKARNRKDITMEEVDAIRKHATLAQAVCPSVGTRRNVKFQNKQLERVEIEGTDEQGILVSNVSVELGRYFTAFESDHNRFVCVLGWEVADRLFEKINPIGRKIKVGGYNFLVVGVMQKQGSILGHSLDFSLQMPIGTFHKLFGSRRWLTIAVKVVDQNLLEEARYELTGILRRVRKVPPSEENDFGINQMSQLTQVYNSLTFGLWAAALIIGGMALLVGGIGVMNIMLVSITERTREIGIRKAIGAKKSYIRWQFFIESIMVCSLGGILGIGMAGLVAQIIASSADFPAAITLDSVILGVAVIFLVGLFFGIYPAHKAARLDPIVALRYE